VLIAHTFDVSVFQETVSTSNFASLSRVTTPPPPYWYVGHASIEPPSKSSRAATSVTVTSTIRNDCSPATEPDRCTATHDRPAAGLTAWNSYSVRPAFGVSPS